MSGQQLAGHVVWITGAGRGLGKEMALRAARVGAVVAATSRSTDDLDALVDEAGSGTVHAYPGSVDSRDAVEAIVRAIEEDHGTLTGLVNNAGISPAFTRSEFVDDDVFARILETNVMGAFRCARAAAGLMLPRGRGSIVNISSVHAQVGLERIAPYAASKGAVEALTKALAIEWAERGVRVNTVAPGYFDTDMSAGLLESRWRERIVRAIPVGRVGNSRELAAAVTYLLSDDASYTTGSTITVDGGWTAW